MLERFLVPVENGIACLLKFEFKNTCFNRELRTRGQANQIIRISQRVCLIEVVNAPTEPPPGAPPRTEAADVKVTDRQYFGRAAQFRTYFRAALHPAIVGAAKKQEQIIFHLRMFVAQIAFDDGWAASNAGFVAFRGLLN